MSKIAKLLEKLKSNPKDFKYSEMVRILENYGYIITQSGKTSGSSVTFRNTKGDKFTIHKPHTGDDLPMGIVKRLTKKLMERGYI